MWDDTSLWFWFASPDNLVVLSIFSCTYWPSVSYLEKIYSDPLPIFYMGLFQAFLLFSCMSSLYILNINTSSDIYFCVYGGGDDGLVAKLCLTICSPMTVTHQAPLSMGFPRQEYWSSCHFLLQGTFPARGSNWHLYISCIGRKVLYH